MNTKYTHTPLAETLPEGQGFSSFAVLYYPAQFSGTQRQMEKNVFSACLVALR
jgi:hypothetical protein